MDANTITFTFPSSVRIGGEQREASLSICIPIGAKDEVIAKALATAIASRKAVNAYFATPEGDASGVDGVPPDPGEYVIPFGKLVKGMTMQSAYKTYPAEVRWLANMDAGKPEMVALKKAAIAYLKTQQPGSGYVSDHVDG